MPRVEAELLPKFGPRGLAALAVLYDPFVRDSIAQLETQISFPLLMDIDNEGQAVFGSPLPSYPRNLVLDREGNIVHWDLDGNLFQVEAAIEAALEG